MSCCVAVNTVTVTVTHACEPALAGLYDRFLSKVLLFSLRLVLLQSTQEGLISNMMWSRVQALRLKGVRYAAEFTGAARVCVPFFFTQARGPP